MSKKRKQVTMFVDEELYKKWGEIAKKLDTSRSAMLDDMLNEILPVIEATINDYNPIKYALNRVNSIKQEIEKIGQEKGA